MKLLTLMMVIILINDFKPAFSEDVASEKAQMKTLQSVAEEADESIKQQTALY